MRLRINNLSFSYSQKKIIDNLSFNIPSGAFLSIIGKNASAVRPVDFSVKSEIFCAIYFI